MQQLSEVHIGFLGAVQSNRNIKSLYRLLSVFFVYSGDFCQATATGDGAGDGDGDGKWEWEMGMES